MKKTLLIIAALLLAMCLYTACADTAQDITDKCHVTATNMSNPYKLLDGKVYTYWTAGSGGSTINITIPEGVTAGGLLVDFYFSNVTYTLEQKDVDGNVIAVNTSDEVFRSLSRYFTISPLAAKLSLRVSGGGQVTIVRVYGEGDIDPDIHFWQPPVEKADIMFVSTHQDDELLWFGGGIPYYSAVRQCDTIVVYMANCGRQRREESLNGLWVSGLRTYPEFVDLKDEKSDFNSVVKLWGGSNKILERMVTFIRKYKPEVIVCQDKNGEYGHPQHRVTSYYLPFAAEYAADPQKYTASYNQYGAWQVKKVYRHLGDENVIYMDWETPSDNLGGLTPIEAATLGFAEHKSQQKGWSMERGKEYDNTKFSLVYTIVGPDVYKDDFLENTPADPRLKEPEITFTPEPTAEPTRQATPTPDATFTPKPTYTPEPTFTAEPTFTPEPTSTPEPVYTAEPQRQPAPENGRYLLYAAAACVVSFALGSGITYISMRRKIKHKRRRKKK